MHGWILGTANYAAYAGIGQARAIEDITRAMTRFPSPSSEVEEAVGKAYREKVLRETGLDVADADTSFAKAKPNPQLIQKFVALGGDVTETDVRSLSPVQLDWGNNPVAEAEAQLLALFRPGELVCCGDWHAKEVQARDVWIRQFKEGRPIPPYVCINPLKPEGGITNDGQHSSRCDDAVSVFRHCLVEFDDLPLDEQVRLLAGLGLDGVTTITFSGVASFHAVIRVDVADQHEWDWIVKGKYYDRLFIPVGCDSACSNPSRLTRLAGAWRVPALEPKFRNKPPEAIPPPAWQRLVFAREEMA